MAMWNDYEKIARRLDRIAKAFERIANALETANIIEADRKTEPQSDARKFLGYACETCKHRDEEWDSEACDGCCENNDHYEKDEPKIAGKHTKQIIIDEAVTEPSPCIFVKGVGWKGQIDTEPQRNMAEDIVESFGFKAESYRQAKAKDEPQTDCSWK